MTDEQPVPPEQPEQVGRVARLWRYPVKSMGGEEVDALDLQPAGPVGDRLWAVHDVERGVVASARRLPALLALRARWLRPPAPDGVRTEPPPVVVTLPDGTELSTEDAGLDAAVSAAVDREVRLVALPPDKAGHRLPTRERIAMADPAVLARDFGLDPDEPLPDFTRMDLAALAQLATYATPPGTFADLSPVHLLTEASLRTVGAGLDGGLDVGRFRPNVLLGGPGDGTGDGTGDGLPEAGWAGSTLVVGTTRIAVTMPTVRCVVPSRAHGDDLPVDRAVTRAVAQVGGRYLGAYADVATGGTVHVGDAVAREPAAEAGPVARTAARARDGVVRGAVGLADSTRRRVRPPRSSSRR